MLIYLKLSFIINAIKLRDHKKIMIDNFYFLRTKVK